LLNLTTGNPLSPPTICRHYNYYPFNIFQVLTVPSLLAEATNIESSENVTLHTILVWPIKVIIISPLIGFHTLIKQSYPQEIRRVES